MAPPEPTFITYFRSPRPSQSQHSVTKGVKKGWKRFHRSTSGWIRQHHRGFISRTLLDRHNIQRASSRWSATLIIWGIIYPNGRRILQQDISPSNPPFLKDTIFGDLWFCAAWPCCLDGATTSNPISARHTQPLCWPSLHLQREVITAPLCLYTTWYQKCRSAAISGQPTQIITIQSRSQLWSLQYVDHDVTFWCLLG